LVAASPATKQPAKIKQIRVQPPTNNRQSRVAKNIKNTKYRKTSRLLQVSCLGSCLPRPSFPLLGKFFKRKNVYKKGNTPIKCIPLFQASLVPEISPNVFFAGHSAFNDLRGPNNSAAARKKRNLQDQGLIYLKNFKIHKI